MCRRDSVSSISFPTNAVANEPAPPSGVTVSNPAGCYVQQTGNIQVHKSMQQTTRITAIEYLDVSGSPLEALSIDRPTPVSTDDVLFLELAGWVVGKQAVVLGLQIMHGEFVLKRIGLDVPRPDVGQRYPDRPYAAKSGFRTYIGLASLPRCFELTIRAVLRGETNEDRDRVRVPLAVVKGEHAGLTSSYSPKRQPLIITALGRSGTTWLMHLLSHHQAVTTVNRYPYEVRAGVYWMHMLNILSAPGNHAQSTAPDGFEADLFHIGNCPYFHPYYLDQVAPDMRQRTFFGQDYVNRLAAFCQKSIDDYYDTFDDQTNGSVSAYFMEKGIGGQIPYLYKNVYQAPREIILVRDFRDMYCSSRAFNERRGYAGFGRERVTSNEEWIEILHRSYSRIIEGWRSRKNEVCLVRYEDLILHPHETLGRILEYLNVADEETVIKCMIKAASKDTPEMKQHRTSTKPSQSIGRWRTDMDSETQAVFRLMFGDLLQQVGYDPDR